MSENLENSTSKEGPCEVCQKMCETKCSACKTVNYCTPEHQKEHWKIHKDVCQKPYEICHSKELGRYVRATKDIEPGDIICVDTPLVFGPKPHLIENGPFPCVGCCKSLNQNNCHYCPECFWPACTPDCEGLKSQKTHGFECQILKLRPPNIGNAKNFFEYFRFDVLIILRALCLQKVSKKKWDTMLNLEDHLEDRGPGTDVFKTVQEKVLFIEENFIKPLKAFEQSTNQVILPQVSSDLIHRIYGILDVNATDFNEDIDSQILYSVSCFFEHNCTPNTSQIIDQSDEFKITFRAALPIAKGENITSIYTNILWGTQERREHLRDTKYFNCVCQRCRDPTELGTFFSALKCLGMENEPCGGTQLPDKPIEEKPKWVCNKCGIKLPNKEVMRFVTHLNSEVDKEMAKKPKMENLEEFLEKLLNFLHPNHFLIYAVKHSLVQVYGNDSEIEISNEFLGQKLKMCQELIDVTKKLDPGNARLSIYLAVLLNELFVAKFKFLARSFDPDNKESSSELVKEIREILKENKTVLTYEVQSTAGKKLFDVVCVNQMRFKNWLEENEVEYEILG